MTDISYAAHEDSVQYNLLLYGRIKYVFFVSVFYLITIYSPRKCLIMEWMGTFNAFQPVNNK